MLWSFHEDKDIFEIAKKFKVQCIVNTTNCLGVQGKGLALAFKNKFPENDKIYTEKCKEGLVKPGDVIVTDFIFDNIIYYIINAATKDHWKNPSKYRWTDKCIENIIETVIKFKIETIAIPPLGCGNGGLDRNIVREDILQGFNRKDLENKIPFLKKLYIL